jgi:hypothetical protein
VRVSIHDECARPCDRILREQIGCEDDEKRTHIPQTAHNVSSVHYEKPVVTVRDEFMRTQLYSRYNRQVVATVNAFANFNSILILPMSGYEV